MITAMVISTLMAASSCCILLSFLPILGQWDSHLQLAGLAFGLAGVGVLIYCMFKNC